MDAPRGPWLEPARSAWTGTLRLDVAEADLPAGLEPDISAFVQITGDWQGYLVLCVTNTLARNAAAAMFDLPAETLEPEMVRDAMGEMANVLGGAVKAGIPGAQGLSLPTVVQGDGHSVFVPDMSLACRAPLRCVGEPMWVCLYEYAGNARRLTAPGGVTRKEAA